MKLAKTSVALLALCVAGTVGAVEYSESHQFTDADTTTEAVSVIGGTAAAPITFSADVAAHGLTITGQSLNVTNNNYFAIESGTYSIGDKFQLGIGYNKPEYRRSGNFTQSGGTVSITGNFELYGGTVSLTGGTMNVGGTFYVGAGSRSSANAVCTIDGCVVTAAQTSLGAYIVTSTLNLKSGSLVTGGFSSGRDDNTKAINFNGGTLKVTQDNTKFIPADTKAFDVVVGTAGGTLDLDNHSITIVPTITGEGTLAIKGGGTLTMPPPSCKVTIASGTAVVIDATDLEMGATLVSSESSLKGASVSAINTSDDFVYGAVLSADEKSFVLGYNPARYIWSGESGAKWSELSSWKVNGATPETLPTDTDGVIVTADTADGAVIDITGSDCHAKNIYLYQNVTIKGDNDKALFFYEIDGTGKVTLDTVKMARIADRVIPSVNVDVELRGNNSFTHNVGSHDRVMSFTKKLSGDGTLAFSSSGQWIGFRFEGDCTGFSGTCDATAGNYTYFANGNATSSNAVWKLGACSGSSVLKTNNTKYCWLFRHKCGSVRAA